MDSKNQILRYLNDTYSIRNILEPFSPLNPDEPGAGSSLLCPWSVQSISFNTGIPENEVMEELEDISGAKVENLKVGDISVQALKMGESLGVQAHSFLETFEVSKISVSEAMNLHMFQFALGRVEENDRPVKIEEAIFDLKNSVFLPDDFMPSHIMGMVEGDISMTAEELASFYSLRGDIKLLYLFYEQKANTTGRARFVYPAMVRFKPELPGNEDIRKKLSESFAGLRTNEKYLAFENSRLLKSAIYNLESKNTRELKRPVFDPRKIGILESLGVAERSSGSAKIKDNISLDQLKDMFSTLKHVGEDLAREWLSSSISLVE